METIKPKKTKIEDTVVGAYQKIEDTVVGTYQKIEDAVVGTYQKIEDKFVEKFLEERGLTKRGTTNKDEDCDSDI